MIHTIYTSSVGMTVHMYQTQPIYSDMAKRVIKKHEYMTYILKFSK